MNTQPNNFQDTIDFINLNQHVAAVCQILENHLVAKKSQTAPENFTDTSHLPPHPALTQLGDKFNLSPFEIRTLLLCAAVELDPSIGLLCADYHSNDRLQYPTPFIACNIFPDATRSSFKPTSPLIKWQLIELKKHQISSLSAMEINPAIWYYILDNSYDEPELQETIEPVNIDSHYQNIPASHKQIIAEILSIRLGATESFTEDFKEDSIVQLCDDSAQAKIAIAARVAICEGRQLNRISLSDLAINFNSPGSSLTREKFIKLYSRFARMTDSIILLDCDQSDPIEPTELQLLEQLLNKSHNPAIVLSRKHLNIGERSIVTLDIPKLTPEEQATIWHVNLGGKATELGEYINSLTHQFNLPAAAIKSACTHSLASMQQSIKADTDFDLKTALWDNCRTYARPRLDSLATRIETQRTWDDIVLPCDKKLALQEIVWHARQKYTVYTRGNASY